MWMSTIILWVSLPGCPYQLILNNSKNTLVEKIEKLKKIIICIIIVLNKKNACSVSVSHYIFYG